MTQITILLIALVLAVGIGLFLRSRAGKVRNVSPTDGQGSRTDMLTAVGVDGARPTILHFSADWCGPCAAVRRVVGQVVTDLSGTPRPPVEIELDIDENPQLAKELGVLSLPTTFILDADAAERFRIAGVPSVADLRGALEPLSA
ncbi:thioredoxin family protein [Antrihabitans cavernicola]|uniref:Thioredoxin family protein n=1 Tax=Antrihabitans cavernicola TaxID=2495913 RepID=A0A5A7S9K9_9NOCA|nr:thioredoxin family protein [Spelaeibacter cavernicola]KAA0021852.1 thioredoxin family protein [Spelaeibacter cavernicola]